MAVYISIVLTGSKTNESTETNPQITELENQYHAKQSELKTAAQPLSDKHLNDFTQYKSRVRAYNATTANSSGLQITDLRDGNGAELTENTNYLAYYIGWCADESVFDSSLDNFENPTLLGAPIPGGNLIEGWKQGVIGMKIGGVRELTIPGELAYGESREVCGTTNSPLKFVVMAIDNDESIAQIWREIDDISTQLQMLYMGVSL
ncbi:FKBP-type peptidyl-prolyl cis-trans isomerase [Candidatus Saccharibacteria bacterium]|nr:FKBP-type peptidyl-prolyl cis-trans isomerase [Candidatus Saccharibacteria bacterium]